MISLNTKHSSISNEVVFSGCFVSIIFDLNRISEKIVVYADFVKLTLETKNDW